MQNGKIAEFIKKYSEQNLHKFSEPRYFIEFLCEAINTDFPGYEDKSKTGKSVIKIEVIEDDLVSVVDAMQILGAKNRWEIDVPLGKGEIKKVKKIGNKIYLDRQSVLDYKKKKSGEKKADEHYTPNGYKYSPKPVYESNLEDD